MRQPDDHAAAETPQVHEHDGKDRGRRLGVEKFKLLQPEGKKYRVKKPGAFRRHVVSHHIAPHDAADDRRHNARQIVDHAEGLHSLQIDVQKKREQIGSDQNHGNIYDGEQQSVPDHLSHCGIAEYLRIVAQPHEIEFRYHVVIIKRIPEGLHDRKQGKHTDPEGHRQKEKPPRYAPFDFFGESFTVHCAIAASRSLLNDPIKYVTELFLEKSLIFFIKFCTAFWIPNIFEGSNFTK